MEKIDFIEKFQRTITVGDVFKNPGRGTSVVISISDEKIYYKRGKSNIGIKLDDIWSSYQKFKGKTISTLELKKFIPDSFDSNARPAGHNCNCTFFFSNFTEAWIST